MSEVCRCGAVFANAREMLLHRVGTPHAPRVYIQPPIGTLVRVPDGGAEAVTGRVVRYDEGMCVVAKQSDPTYEVWAYVEATDLVEGALTMQEWRVRSRAIDELVAATDQWAAWNTLRNRPVEDFGLVTVAMPDGDEASMIPVHTATLMRRWDRLRDAIAFDDLARSKGLLPDPEHRRSER